MRLMTKTNRLHARESYIPKGARCILEHTNGSALYSYETLAGKPCAIAFWGTAARSTWHHSYRTEAQRNDAIATFKASVEASVTSKTERAAAKSAWSNPLTVGAILHTCWGYDQTNVEFYVVTKVSGRKVSIAPIKSDYEATGYMSGKTWPAMPIQIVGEETSHIAQPSGASGVYVKISSCVNAWPETGREHSTSSYA